MPPRLQQKACRDLRADAGHLLEGLAIPRGHRLRKRIGRMHRQHGEREPGPHALYRLQRLERVALVLRTKTEQRQGVLTHNKVGVHPHGGAVTEVGERGGRRQHLHADAAGLDHRRRRADGQHRAMQRGDHASSFERMYEYATG
ncbi:hypothetical protein GCM10025876_00610 [Demequina litorisediminis]|uniref:Uncharacterized protein n=1 Tax=Demequina litorisediminis TaxID=1849022 RepID=A0ABQ6I9H1_9MICO|nr:hypothetical protein GCM10025876_00610 [Demequina litorisediminis]